MADSTAHTVPSPEATCGGKSLVDLLLDASHDTIALLDTSGYIIRINKSGARNLGSTQDRLIGKRPFDSFPPDIAESRWRCFQQVLRTGKAIHFDDTRNGVHLANSLYPVFSPDHEIEAVAIFARDISERKDAERAILESEGKYRSLFENMLDGFALHEVVLDNTGTPVDYLFLEANEAFERLTGLCREEIIGRRVTEVLPGIEADEADWIGQYGKVALDGCVLRFEQHSEALNKTFSVLAYKTDANRFATIFEDISNRKQAENALIKSEEEYRLIFETAADLIITVDPDGKIVDCNSQITQVLGYQRVEILGQPVTGLIHADCLRRAEESLAEVLATGYSYDNECQFVARDGSLIDVVVNSSGAGKQGDSYERIICLVRDITERKRIAREQKALQNELLQAQKMESVARLAGGIAHDINNMLTSISGFTHLAMGSIAESNPAYANLSDALECTRRSSDIVRQLLAFARKQTAVPRVVNMNDSIEQMLKMLQRLIGENIELVWQADPALWPVRIDPVQLDQILANLCVNSRDAIAAHGRITVRTRAISIDKSTSGRHCQLPPGDYALLTVSDNGEGMDDDTLGHAFDPFFTTKGTGKGTGLGLSTVYGIVVQNKGHIDVESALGQGTTFRLYFPRSAEEPGERTPPTEKAAQIGNGETILIVEDEASVRKVTELALKKFGYNTMAAGDPAQALELLSQSRMSVDVLITDMVMPQMSGRELAEMVAELYPDISIILMSGYTTDLSPEFLQSESGWSFLQKPFTSLALAEKVREIIAKRH